MIHKKNDLMMHDFEIFFLFHEDDHSSQSSSIEKTQKLRQTTLKPPNSSKGATFE